MSWVGGTTGSGYMPKKVKVSGKTRKNTKQATPPKHILLNCQLTLKRAQLGWFALIASAVNCGRWAICTTINGCGLQLTWCIGGTFVGRLGRFCFYSIS